MKNKARQTLEYIIKTLDEENQPPQKGSWKDQIKKETKPANEKTLKQTYFNLNVIMNGQQATDDAIGRMLVGENILTPALIHKGWQFWKLLPVTNKEKEAIESAVISWSNDKVAKIKSLEETFETLPDTDDTDLRNPIYFIASVLDINYSCRQKFSDYLKTILAAANSD